MKIHFALVCALLCPLACGGSKSGDASGGHAGGATCVSDCAASGSTGLPFGGSGASSLGGSAPGSDPGAAGSATAETAAVYGPQYFRFGDNPGYYGAGIDRRESAQMSVAAGASSLRTTLPEYYLQKWGDTIEVADYAAYQPLGLGHHACFLIAPSHEHSNAPADASDSDLAHYSPKNLYEPIFTSDGKVNPDNYWAAYVERVAKNYGQYLDMYEVWNEPDQVGGNWQATQSWDDTPPNPKDLIWWNDSIFSYIRLLRITHEVVHKFDPDASVTVGGIGYGSFLSALLRYTDEPKAGAPSAEYPETAAKYLDILSFHYYPVFGGGSSDTGVDGLLKARDDFRERLNAAGAGERKFVVTETGAPRYAVGGNVGGADYSANYLVKVMTLGHYEGLLGVDWFAQGDGAAIGASTDSFAYMGLYFDYSKAMQVSDAKLSPQGAAYAWLKTWLPNTAADPAALAKLELPRDVRGAAFTTADDHHLYVLWARTMNDETATASYSLPASGSITVHSFSLEKAENVAVLAAKDGAIALTLSGMPTAVEVP
ncbi:MAG TPA: hypothetical protein VFK05_34980 [Polyangiaceae bacterium]|nr:hypothetical protein [Polyangiaceae bacterium]